MASISEDKDGKIMSITVDNSRYRYCNVCEAKINDDVAGKLSYDNKIHQLEFGKHKRSMLINLCTNCLNEFADLLWQYLEEEV